MITFRDKHSGYEVKGLLFKKTDDCYAVADKDGIKLLRSDDWEEVRDADQSISGQAQAEVPGTD